MSNAESLASTASSVTVLFFARHREQMGMASCAIPIDAALPLAALKQQLAERYPQFSQLRPPLMAAINQVMADETQWVQVGDEVAFFPPVTGG